MVSLLASSPSLAVSISTYEPDALNVAVVTVSFGCANVTVPGPLTLLQVVTRSPPGMPSSVATPTSDAVVDGTIWSAPAFTTGGRFGTPALTWMETESLALSSPSLAGSANTKGPGRGKGGGGGAP